jgi:hypothetical protein
MRKRRTDRSRYDAIDLLVAVMNDLKEDRYGQAMCRIGMDLSLFDEDTTLEELAGVFQVRLIELAKVAGVKIDTEGNK